MTSGRCNSPSKATTELIPLYSSLSGSNTTDFYYRKTQSSTKLTARNQNEWEIVDWDWDCCSKCFEWLSPPSLSLVRVSRGQRSYVWNRTAEIVVCFVFEVKRCPLDGWDFITWDAWVSCYRRGANTQWRREGTVTQSAGAAFINCLEISVHAANSFFWESFEGWIQMQILKWFLF